jgi:hypothetical protein
VVVERDDEEKATRGAYGKTWPVVVGRKKEDGAAGRDVGPYLDVKPF